MNRIDHRKKDQLREIKIHKNFLLNANGSVLIEQGNTRVICAVSVTPGVPRWMKEQNVKGGWLTGEYQMLPASTGQRSSRDISRGRLNGRSQEIQRLIGRSLRAIVDLKKLGENTVYVDCDVIDADGGTRCASITGASVALHLAFKKMLEDKKIEEFPMSEHVIGISVGMVRETALLDLCYEEDSKADVDMNVIMTEGGRFIEVQGTAESDPFSQKQMDQMLELAKKGILEIAKIQNKSVEV